jgi:hypothetical protein
LFSAVFYIFQMPNEFGMLRAAFMGMSEQAQPTLRIAIQVMLNGTPMQREGRMARMQATQPGRLWAEPAPDEKVHPPTLAYYRETYLVIRACVKL